MSGERVLMSFVGNRDPHREDGEPGPVLSLLEAREYDAVVLLCTGPEYLDRAKRVKRESEEEIGPRRFEFVMLELESVVDYRELLLKLTETVRRVHSDHAHRKPEFEVLLDPGTPQMQTVWFILVQRKVLEAKLLQGVPPHLAGGRYRVKEIDVAPLLQEAYQTAEVQEPEARDAYPGEPPASGPPQAAPGRSAPRAEPPRAKLHSFAIGTSPILGESESFRRALDMAENAASYDVPVLIRGETGTGKELLARLVHEKSSRREGVFFTLNCANINASLAESALFGHEKGAFTGAENERMGAFRAADGGTLFLDEIGDLPVEIQPKFLRVLEEQTVTPVGSDTPVRVDVRIVAATNRPLYELVDEGEFRQDLMSRLTQAEIELPPLRERQADIPILLKHFLTEWNEQYRENRGLSPELFDLLLDYPWPGNVRELQNVVRNMCATQRTEQLTPNHLPPALRRHFEALQETPGKFSWELPKEGIDLKAYLFQIEKHFYDEALRRARGNREQAARLLGLNGPAFRKALKERFGEE
ncbi:MAG: sigma-54 interaction domain-containing protein [Spirochaetaceae bacterium]